jgi:hypothetical protein
MVYFGTILKFIVSKEGKKIDPKKKESPIQMLIPNTPYKTQMFCGISQFHRCLIIHFAFIMAPITKLLKKTKVFGWLTKCQIGWEDIKI